MMKVQIIYNKCMCFQSQFIVGQAPDDMEIMAAVGGPVTQNLAEQIHSIGEQYGQSCGTYTVRMEPDLDFIRVYSADGQDFPNKLELAQATEADIGVHQITMFIEQIEENGDGFFKPERGFMNTISYTFQVTVNPCSVSSIIKTPAITETVQYQIGDPQKQFGPYAFAQEPQCGYEATVEVTGLPDFIFHEDLNQQFTIEQTFDASLIRSYTVTIRQTLVYPTSAIDPSQTQTISTQALYRVEVLPCGISEVTTPVTIESVDYNLGDAGFRFGEIFFESDSACDFEFDYELLDAPSNVQYSLDTLDLEVQQSLDLSLRGQYLVGLQASVTGPDSTIYSAVIQFTLTINPCQIFDLTVSPTSFAPIEYTLGESGFNFGSFTFTQDLQCGYEKTISATGLPSLGFVQLRESQSDFQFTPTSDFDAVGLYTVTLACQLTFPLNWEQSGPTDTITTELTFEIQVNPCFVETFEPTSTPIGTITYQLGDPDLLSFGLYTFTQDPNCGYAETITIDNLPPYVQHNTAEQTFTIASISSPAGIEFLGEHNIVIRSEFTQTDYTSTIYPMSSTIEFQLIVTACQVDSLVVVQAPPAEVSYTLGEAGFTFGPYEFAQTPDCGYPMTVRFFDLPPLPYFSHNESTRDFTISQTSILDADFLGVYNMVITGEFQQLNDNKQFSLVSQIIEVEIIVSPCQVNSFDVTSEPIGPVFYILDNPAITFGPYGFAQNPDCGYPIEESFENVPLEPYVVLDQNTRIFAVDRTADEDFLGVYDIVIRQKFDQLNIDKTTTEILSTVEFKFTVGSCTVDSFDVVQAPQAEVSYTLGEAGFTVGPYEFAQTPDCGYLTTVNFSNLPAEAFFAHDEGARTFTVIETTDIDFLGIYDIQILAQFEQLNIDGSTTIVTQLIDFELTVSPCIVDSLDVTSDPIGPVSYILDEAAFEFGPYQFTQNPPECDYPTTVSFEDLPAEPFLVHDPSTRKFSVSQTSDTQYIGVYNVVIQSEYEQRNIDKTTTTVTQTIEFQFIVSPCMVDSFDVISDPIDAQIHYTLDTPGFSIGPYQFAQNPNCGYPATVSFQNIPVPFVVHDENTRTLEVARTADPDFFGVYDVVIESRFEQLNLDLSKTTVAQTIEFQLTVSPCIVISYDVLSPQIDPIFYTLDDPSETFGYYEFAQNPDCGYAETITLLGMPSDQYVTHDKIQQEFTIEQTDENEFIGIYDVIIQSQFEQPDISGSKETITQTISFKITVSPCTVDIYSVTSAPIGFVQYVLGNPQQNFGPYMFVQTPECGYQQTVTFQNLPEQFVKHNEGSKDFTIDSTLDRDFLGNYEVVIRSEFLQPKISGLPEPVATSISFDLIVNPCQITSFESPTTIGPIEYTIGGASFDFGSYLFEQEPACEYESTISVSGLPDFVEHRSDNQDFQLISTEDLTQVNTYTVTLTSSISIPDDNSENPTFSETESSIIFTIEAINPCLATILEPITAEDMTTSVQGTGQTENLQADNPQDSVSQTLGDATGLTYCGERQFRIVSSGHENFLSYNEISHVLTLLSTNKNDVGSIDVTIQAYLVDYQEINVSTTFTVTITACQVISLLPVQTNKQAYKVNSAPHLIQIKPFTQVPDCESDVTYTVTIQYESSPEFEVLPAWIVQDQMELTVSTSNFALIGVYQLRVTAQATTGPVSDPMVFELQVSSPECESEQLTADAVFDDITYLIAKQDPIEQNLSWVTDVDKFACPYEHSITIIENGSERVASAADLEVVSFDESTGVLWLEANDFAYDGREWTILLTRTSMLSKSDQREASHSLVVTFKDICWDSTLIAPQFLQNSLSFELYESQSIFFNNMENQSEGSTFCGGFTYSMIYVSGPLTGTGALSVYTIAPVSANQHIITGTLTGTKWIGRHTIKVMGTNGISDERRMRSLQNGSSSRGNNGLFNSVLSEAIVLNINNPCLFAVLNPDKSFRIPLVFTVPLGESKITQQMLGTKDSVSVAYGNGYDLCGPRSYQVYTDDDTFYESDSFTMTREFSTDPTMIGADKLSISLLSFEQGPIMAKRVRVLVFLEEYPDRKISFPMDLEFRECYAKDFMGGFIEKQRIPTGQLPYEVSLQFVQDPCQFKQTYWANIVDQESEYEMELPGFIELRLNKEFENKTPTIYFNTATPADVGEYKVRVYSQLENYYRNMTQVDFRIVVYQPSIIDWSLQPLFEVKLADQRVAVNSSLIYRPDFQIQSNAWTFKMQVNLGRSNKFTQYDEFEKKFSCAAQLVEKIDIGEHQVLITVLFTRNQEVVQFTRSFKITVYEEEIIGPGGPEEPPDVDTLPNWESGIKSSLVPEIYDESANKPIPFIERLTETGLLTIGWDRKMSPPGDYYDIPDKKVAIDDISSFDQDEIDQRLEFSWYKRDGDIQALRLALIDAMEVRIFREDPEAEVQMIDFTWDILNYSQHYIQIQLDIKNAESIADDLGEPDNLTVTFWGTEYFKSSQGDEVRYGSEVSIKILRQINPVDAAQLDGGMVYIKAYIIMIVLVAMAFFSLGSLLPMWIFVNSLQIITHTTLLNTVMPGNAHLVLKQYLDMVRLNFPDLNQALYNRQNNYQLGNEAGLYNVYLEASDYVHFFGQNLVIISLTGFIMILTWIGLAVKDYMGTKPRWAKRNQFLTVQHEPGANNFALRFFYEMFFEFCLCVLINLSITDFSSFSPSAQWLASLLIAISIVAYMAWIISLFFYNGPFLDNFYNKGTFFQSIWNARPFNTKFDAKKKLLALNAKRERQKVRACKREKMRQFKQLQNTTQKVTPLDLEILGLGQHPTERALLGALSPYSERGSNLSMKEADLLSQRSGVSSDQPQNRLSNPEIMYTGASTHMNFKTERSQAIPTMRDLIPDQDVNRSQPDNKIEPIFGEGVVFSETGIISKIEGEKSQMIGAILDFDQSASQGNERGSTISERKASLLQNIPVEHDTSIDNPAIYTLDTNVQGPSRTTLNHKSDSINHFGCDPPTASRSKMASISPVKDHLEDQREQLMFTAMAAHQGEKGNTPPSDSGLSLGFDSKQGYHGNVNSVQKQQLSLHIEEEHPVGDRAKTAIGVGPSLFNNQVMSGDAESSQGRMYHNNILSQKKGSAMLKTPAFPSAYGFSKRQSSSIMSPLSFREPSHSKNLRESVDSEENSDQITGPSRHQLKSQRGQYSTAQMQTEGNEENQYEGGSAEKTVEKQPVQQTLTTENALLQQSEDLQSPNPTRTDGRRRSSKKKKKKGLMFTDPKYRYFMSQKVSEVKHRKIVLEKKKKHEDIIMCSAREMIAGADLIEKPRRFKTLYYGLKLNHPRNVALIHPLMFTIRRIVYALSIVFLSKVPLFGVWILLVGTMLMLAFAVTEQPWRDQIINHQHIFNEIITYMICIFLLLFNGVVEAKMRYTLGYFMIGIISIFLVYNGIIMMRKVTKLCQLLLRKWRVHRRQRNLLAEANLVSKKIKATLDEMFASKQPLNSDEEEEDIEQARQKITPASLIKVEIGSMSTGGLRGLIGQDDKQIALLNQQLQQEEEAPRDIPWQLSQIKEGSSGAEISGEYEESSIYDSDEERKQISSSIKRQSELSPINESLANRMSRLNTEQNLLRQSEPTPDRRPISQQNIPLRPFSGDPFKTVASVQNDCEGMGNLQEVILDEEKDIIKTRPIKEDSKENFDKDDDIVSCSSYTDSEKLARQEKEQEEQSQQQMFETKRWFIPDYLTAEQQFIMREGTDEEKIKMGLIPQECLLQQSSQEQYGDTSLPTTPKPVNEGVQAEYEAYKQVLAATTTTPLTNRKVMPRSHTVESVSSDQLLIEPTSAASTHKQGEKHMLLRRADTVAEPVPLTINQGWTQQPNTALNANFMLPIIESKDEGGSRPNSEQRVNEVDSKQQVVDQIELLDDNNEKTAELGPGPITSEDQKEDDQPHIRKESKDEFQTDSQSIPQLDEVVQEVKKIDDDSYQILQQSESVKNEKQTATAAEAHEPPKVEVDNVEQPLEDQIQAMIKTGASFNKVVDESQTPLVSVLPKDDVQSQTLEDQLQAMIKTGNSFMKQVNQQAETTPLVNQQSVNQSRLLEDQLQAMMLTGNSFKPKEQENAEGDSPAEIQMKIGNRESETLDEALQKALAHRRSTFRVNKIASQEKQSNLNLSNLLPKTPSQAGETESLHVNTEPKQHEADIPSAEISKILDVKEVKAGSDEDDPYQVTASGQKSSKLAEIQAQAKRLFSESRPISKAQFSKDDSPKSNDDDHMAVIKMPTEEETNSELEEEAQTAKIAGVASTLESAVQKKEALTTRDAPREKSNDYIMMKRDQFGSPFIEKSQRQPAYKFTSPQKAERAQHLQLSHTREKIQLSTQLQAERNLIDGVPSMQANYNAAVSDVITFKSGKNDVEDVNDKIMLSHKKHQRSMLSNNSLLSNKKGEDLSQTNRSNLRFNINVDQEQMSQGQRNSNLRTAEKPYASKLTQDLHTDMIQIQEERRSSAGRDKIGHSPDIDIFNDSPNEHTGLGGEYEVSQEIVETPAALLTRNLTASPSMHFTSMHQLKCAGGSLVHEQPGKSLNRQNAASVMSPQQHYRSAKHDLGPNVLSPASRNDDHSSVNELPLVRIKNESCFMHNQSIATDQTDRGIMGFKQHQHFSEATMDHINMDRSNEVSSPLTRQYLSPGPGHSSGTHALTAMRRVGGSGSMPELHMTREKSVVSGGPYHKNTISSQTKHIKNKPSGSQVGGGNHTRKQSIKRMSTIEGKHSQASDRHSIDVASIGTFGSKTKALKRASTKRNLKMQRAGEGVAGAAGQFIIDSGSSKKLNLRNPRWDNNKPGSKF